MKPPRDNKPYGSIQNLPPSERPNPNAHSGECILNDPVPFCHDIYHPGVPNPVMVEYHHNHKPKPPRPFDNEFVTKKELNEILRNIAKATLFEDETADGTTCSVGGISTGTKFSNKLTFTDFIKQLLYPEEQTFDFLYPCKDKDGSTILEYIVKSPIGGFKEGDSLEGMYVCEIIEKLLCGGSNMWGKYIWKSDLYDLPSGQFEIDASEFCPELVKDIENDTEGVAHWYETQLMKGKYELYVVVPTADKDDPSLFKYDCLIACINTEDNPEPQVTNPTWSDVPESLTWTYNSDTNMVVLSGSGITADMSIAMIARHVE